MALQQNISTEYGIYASYWKITGFVLNLDGSCDLTLAGFYDSFTRNGMNAPLKSLSFKISANDVANYFPSGVDLTQVYAYLKTLPEFSMALDV